MLNVAKCLMVVTMSMLCSAVLGQNRSFSGAWLAEPRADRNKSALTLSQYPGGIYSLNTSTIVFRFRCDGKRYPPFNRLLGKETGEGICTAMTASSFNVSCVMKDRPLGSLQFQVSADGSSLAYTKQRSTPNGKNQVSVFKYARLSGSKTLFGDWRSDDEDPTNLLRIAMSDRAVTLDFPHARQTAVLPVSGAEVHTTIDGAASKGTQALVVEGKNKFRTVTREAGVAIQQATFTLSEDGNTLTEYGWLLQHPENSATYIYHRSQ